MNSKTRKPGRGEGRILFLVFWLSNSLLLLLLLSSCKREERGFRVAPPAADKLQVNSTSDLPPTGGAPPPLVKNDYEENAYATSEGQRLYSAMNCVGCH